MKETVGADRAELLGLGSGSLMYRDTSSLARVYERNRRAWVLALKALGKLLTAAGDALGIDSFRQQAIYCVVSFGTFPTVASCPILPLLVETQIKLCDLLLAEELLKTVSEYARQRNATDDAANRGEG